MSRSLTQADRRRLRELGRTLRGYRDAQGLSRPAVARTIESSPSTLKGMEAGEHAMSRAFLGRLFAALKVPAEEQERLGAMLPSKGPRCPACDAPLVCPKCPRGGGETT